MLTDGEVSAGLGDEGAALLALIAELCLEDVDDVAAGRKGKSKASFTPSDEEIAFELFAQEAKSLLDFTKDLTYARSIDSALETDRALVEEHMRLEIRAHEDREFALALSQGRVPVNRSIMPGTTSSSNGKQVANPLSMVLRRRGLESTTPSSSKTRLTDVSLPNDSSRLAVTLKHETCVFCRDIIQGIEILAPCGHYWDTGCLADLFRAATMDETLFPPRCCQQPFVLDKIRRHLEADLCAVFEKKSIELSTADRVYCYRPTCSSFIGPATPSPHMQICPACRAYTCAHCKQAAHPSKPCPDDDASILALAEEEGWKRCPGCRRLVELTQGCYHMTCRCRKQFCYVCTETWKNCNCPQWDEARLLVTAENRVQRQLHAGPPPAPVEFRQMVAHAADRLRVDHDCQHTWRYRSGGGQCENCYHYLGVFLLNCRYCDMNVCVRCRRNRL